MKELDTLIDELKYIFGNRLCSVLIFGSMANYGLDKIKSNVDLMIIINKFSSQDLKRIQPTIKKWINAKNPHPIVMSKEEFFKYTDTYSIEYADIKWNYQNIYGENIFQNIDIKYNCLKDQCKEEIKHLLMKFRGYYLEHGQNKKNMKEAFLNLTDSCLVIFRTILRLQNVLPSVFKNDLIDQIADIIRIDKVLFKRLLASKEGKSDLPDYILEDGIMLTINQLTMILQQVESM